VEGLRFDLPLLLKAINDILVTPANFVRQTLDSAVLAPRLQSEHTKSSRNDHTLLFVIWWGDTLKELEAFNGSGTAGGLVGNHSADGLEEDFGRCTVMERAGFLRVDDMTFMKEVVVAEFVAEEAAGDVDLLAAHDDDLLAREDLLGDNGGQPTQEMALAVDDNRARGEGRHS